MRRWRARPAGSRRHTRMTVALRRASSVATTSPSPPVAPVTIHTRSTSDGYGPAILFDDPIIGDSNRCLLYAGSMELSTVGVTKYAEHVPAANQASESLIYALAELTF